MSAPLWVIVGPTASGKTALAVRLAEQLGGEVVSADSVAVYREFELGTGKPSAEERSRAPHHLIDIADPLEAMDAARWAELADSAIVDIRARGRVPIVCGGTFLWVKALLFGLAAAPPADEALRQAHRELVERDGRAALHERLRAVDAVSADKLAPNDFVRVSRALEVHELTGRPLSEWQKEHRFAEQRHDARLIGVGWTRDELAERIIQRTRWMLEAGLVDEVRRLLERGYGQARAMRSVGYRQVVEAFASDKVPNEDELLDSIARATRVFTRRQRTWLRDQPVEWLEPGKLPSAS